MIKRLLKEVKEYKKYAFITPLCMIVEVFCDICIPFLMSSIIDKGVNAGDMNHIVKIGGYMLLVALLGLGSGLLGGVFASKASTGFAKNLRETMFAHIQTFSFSNIDKFSTAGLVTRLTTDVSNVQMGFQMLLRMMMRAPGTMICALIMSFTINARIASVYLIAVVFLSAAIFFILKRGMGLFRKAFPKYDELNGSVEENVTAIRVVKAFVREEEEIKKFKLASSGIAKIFTKAESSVAIQMPLMNATVYTCILLISWIGAKMIASDSLTTGELMSLLAYCMNILMSLMMVSMIFVMFSIGFASIERISEVLSEVPDVQNPENPVCEVPNGEIIFDHVDFAYSRDAKENVLKDINLRIKSGETIGIIGPTGSAKTSLVNLISRLYDVTGGSLSVGGRDVREYDLKTLRDSVSVVLQNNTLFSGTVIENLRWGKEDATEEECINACKLACADSFLEKMEKGYYSPVDQGGANFSGGQKQRLCIARALMKSPKVLILDDSTSAVDTATDASIRKAFRENIPGTTKIIIAQRISSVMDADRIIVMEDGKINGIGNHEELLAGNEIYQDVYYAQTSGGDFDENNGNGGEVS